jgi:transcription initiation factor TFIIB
METTIKTKKKKRNKINKKEIWKTFGEDIKNLNNIECIYQSKGTNVCEVCDSMLSYTEEGYMSCSNNKCAIIYKDIIDQTAEWKQFSEGGADLSRCGMPINPLLEESSFGCKVSCNSKSSYEMRKIKRYSEWQSMPYKEKSQYDEFQRIINMAQNGDISKIIIDDAIRYHKLISDNTTFRGLNRDGIIAASIYIACRINKTPRSAKEIAKIFHLDNTAATKGCKNAVTIINTIEQDLCQSDKTDFGTTNSESFIERYCSKMNIPSDLVKLALFVSKLINSRNMIPENTPPAIAAGIIYFIIIEFRLDISKSMINQVSEISEVTINKCYKKIDSHKDQLIPQKVRNRYICGHN